MKVEKISGIGEYEREGEKYLINGKAFLVEHKNTVEVRCDRELAEKFVRKKKLLR